MEMKDFFFQNFLALTGIPEHQFGRRTTNITAWTVMNSDHFVVHPMKSWKDKYTHDMFLRSRILEPARLENGVKCRMDTSCGGWFDSVVSVAPFCRDFTKFFILSGHRSHHLFFSEIFVVWLVLMIYDCIRYFCWKVFFWRLISEAIPMRQFLHTPGRGAEYSMFVFNEQVYNYLEVHLTNLFEQSHFRKSEESLCGTPSKCFHMSISFGSTIYPPQNPPKMLLSPGCQE